MNEWMTLPLLHYKLNYTGLVFAGHWTQWKNVVLNQIKAKSDL